MKDIIKELYIDDGKFQYEAVKRARENKGKINQYLLDEISDIIQNLGTDGVAPLFLDYAIYLLAEFREKRLFLLLIDLLDRPFVNTLDCIGMGIMDKLPSIMASVFDGHFEGMERILENKDIDGYCKARVMSFYQYCYKQDLIKKDDLIAYLRKLVKLYDYNDDWMYQEIMSLVADLHIIEMIEDVKVMFSYNVINLRYRGGYDDFIDDIFNYDDIYVEKINLVESVEKSMTWWNCFSDKEEESSVDYDKVFDAFQKIIEKDVVSYQKVGRNDLCPCGSGKKYKKCCWKKKDTLLPYQGYIDKTLARYPKRDGVKGEVDFYSYYKEDYIKIDQLLYKGLKRKEIPLTIKRNLRVEEKIDLDYLSQAYELIKEVIFKQSFKTIDEYDSEVSIHFSLYHFFQKYSELIIHKIDNPKSEWVIKLGDLLDFFYEHFELEDEREGLFLDRKNAFYSLSKRYEEGIEFFLGKLSTCCDKYDVYSSLFDEYMGYYDYDEAMRKIDELIEGEKDKQLKMDLEELRLEFMDEE